MLATLRQAQGERLMQVASMARSYKGGRIQPVL